MVRVRYRTVIRSTMSKKHGGNKHGELLVLGCQVDSRVSLLSVYVYTQLKSAYMLCLDCRGLASPCYSGSWKVCPQGDPTVTVFATHCLKAYPSAALDSIVKHWQQLFSGCGMQMWQGVRPQVARLHSQRLEWTCTVYSWTARNRTQSGQGVPASWKPPCSNFTTEIAC